MGVSYSNTLEFLPNIIPLFPKCKGSVFSLWQIVKMRKIAVYSVGELFAILGRRCAFDRLEQTVESGNGREAQV